MLHGTLSCVAAWLGEDVQHVTGWNSASTPWLSWLLFSTTRLLALFLGIVASSDKSQFSINSCSLNFSTLSAMERVTLSRSTRATSYQYQGVDACRLGAGERISQRSPSLLSQAKLECFLRCVGSLLVLVYGSLGILFMP